MNILVTLAPAEETDRDEFERLTRGMRSEITELDVDSVEFVPGGRAPAGSKSADPVTLGAVIVALSASGGVFPTLVATLRDWLGRLSAPHKITLTIDGDTIEVERATAAQQNALIDAYIKRHGADE